MTYASSSVPLQVSPHLVPYFRSYHCLLSFTYTFRTNIGTQEVPNKLNYGYHTSAKQDYSGTPKYLLRFSYLSIFTSTYSHQFPRQGPGILYILILFINHPPHPKQNIKSNLFLGLKVQLISRVLA